MRKHRALLAVQDSEASNINVWPSRADINRVSLVWNLPVVRIQTVIMNLIITGCNMFPIMIINNISMLGKVDAELHFEYDLFGTVCLVVISCYGYS